MLRNGLFVNEDDTYYAIVNGSMYEVVPFDNLKPGYYDENLNPVSEAEALGNDEPQGS